MKSIKSFLYFTVTFAVLLFAVSACSPAYAYVVPVYRDLKPATQAMLEKQSFGSPVASAATYVASAASGSISASATTLSSFAAQPDVARNLFITPGGTTGDIEACNVTVNGTNILGRSIAEVFTFTANQTSAVVGAKAFKTVSSVAFPLNCESGTFAASWSIGVGEKIGLKRCMSAAGDWAWSHVSGVYSATRPTVVASASVVEGNTADFSETMDGSAPFVGYFVQNFSCLP